MLSGKARLLLEVLRDRLGAREDKFFATVFLGTGLLFVAMSINIKEILAFPQLPRRAAETVIVLVGALVAASAALLPGLSTRGLGLILVVVTTVTWLMAT